MQNKVGLISNPGQGGGARLKLTKEQREQFHFGFADESSPEANSNKARWWSFYKKPRKVNTHKSMRQNTFGYYVLKGQSIITEITDSKAARSGKDSSGKPNSQLLYGGVG